MLEEFKIEQPVVYKTMMNSIKNNKCSHAYLIESNGYPKAFELALAFAKTILYTNHNTEINEDINNNGILELKVIEADGQWIKKNQLEELQYDFSKKSILGNKKIYIIKEAEKLNISSANSLLKFLEEPEEGIIAILLTDNIYKLIDTIISRCQILKLKNPQASNLGNILEKLGNILYKTKEDINLYLNNDSSLLKVEKIIEFVKYYETNGISTLIYVNKLWNQYFFDRKDFFEAFYIMLLFYKDVFNYKINNKIENFDQYVNDIKYVSEKNAISVIISKINVIMELQGKIKFNINNNLLMDKLLIELESCEQNG